VCIKSIIITFRRVLKTAILDSTQEFRLEKEILETRRMNTYVSFLDLQQRNNKRLDARHCGKITS
jgi:hypothetical protein